MYYDPDPGARPLELTINDYSFVKMEQTAQKLNKTCVSVLSTDSVVEFCRAITDGYWNRLIFDQLDGHCLN